MPPCFSDPTLSTSGVPTTEEFGERLSLLSRQERAVIDLATSGRSDAQIAQALSVSASTVNSYWVRIRGKLGPLGRTEIAALFLRHEAALDRASIQAENRRLREELERTREESDLRLVAQGVPADEAWPLLALVHAPEAMLVTAPPATVVFANRQARLLYRAGVRELIGLPMRELTTGATPEEDREPCRDLFKEGGPERETVGVDEPYFARRRDGTNFRAVLHAERFAAAAQPFAVVTVREFLGEAETILRALRQPLTENAEAN